MMISFLKRRFGAYVCLQAVFNLRYFVVSGYAYLNRPITFRAEGSASKPLIILETTSDDLQNQVSRNVRNLSFAVILGAGLALSGSHIARASEIGVEVEAPTFITGETVEICTKRGPLGACLKTEMRTESNDNDISRKYFKDPSQIIKQREAAMVTENEEGNSLIQKLRQQSIDNAEKNNLIVQRKTFENDQVLIMNTDGRTFSLLQNPQAMRLKKAGFIDNKRQFIKQPTQEELDKALESESFFSGLFGGS